MATELRLQTAKGDRRLAGGGKEGTDGWDEGEQTREQATSKRGKGVRWAKRWAAESGQRLAHVCVCASEGVPVPEARATYVPYYSAK